MPARDNIQAQGTVTEVLKHGACRVELDNGHRCIARAPEGAHLSMGDRVQLEFHPYDLSRGRIILPG